MTTVAPTAVAAAEATTVAAVVTDRVVAVVGVSAPGAGSGVVGPEVEQAPAGAVGLAFGLGEGREEAVEAEAAADDLDRHTLLGERFGVGDRVAFLVEPLLPLTCVSEDVAGHAERVGAAGAAL